MTTLAGDITAGQTFTLNTEDMAAFPPGFYTLDDELVDVATGLLEGWVEGVYTAFGRPIERAKGGTSAAAHTAGTAFVSASGPAAPVDPFTINGTLDPGADGGVPANVGMNYLRVHDEVDNVGRPLAEWYMKIGPADTDWILTTREPFVVD